MVYRIDEQDPPAEGLQNPAAPAINPRHLNLIKLFTSQTSTLPKFRATKGELWRSFETTFRIKKANSSLEQFSVPMQKRALLACLEGPAARAHTLLAEGTRGGE